jgi:predicted amidohydrolase YtcJ
MSQIDRASPATPPALAIVNARVWTNDPRRRWADALLLRDGRVVAVGSSAELRKRAGADVAIVDARGWLVLPTCTGDSLVPGALATLIIAERATFTEPPSPADENAVTFALSEGRIVLDRHGLAG